MGIGRTVAIALVAEIACLAGVVVAMVELWRRRTWRIPDLNKRFAAAAPCASSIAISCACAATLAHVFLGDGAPAGVLALSAGSVCGAVAGGGLLLMRKRDVPHKTRLTWSFGLLLFIASTTLYLGVYELRGGVS